MKRSDIVRAFDKVKPTEEQTDRMLENILNSQKKSHFRWHSFVPAIAAALVVITAIAGFKALDTAGKLPVSLEGFVDTAKSFFTGEDKNSSALTTTADSAGKQKAVKSEPEAETESTNPAQVVDTEIEKVEKTFTLNSVTYKEVTEELAKDLPVDITVKTEDVGKLIAIVEEENEFFGGEEIRKYLPIKGSFFLVLEDRDGNCRLFMFDNTTENDIKTYFDIFGITSAEDIAEVTISEGEKTAVIEDIQKVFEELSKAEGDKDEYEKAVKALIKPVPAAEPDVTEAPKEEETTAESATVTEETETSAPETPAVDVEETVFRTVTIKIKTVSGLVYETAFYPQIDYVSTCKISNDFSEFLKTVL
ncbi:MAG: hypothetical protein K5756_05570 [Clostridiales bacterium]|nr:hypothetical protein [Clostridiales bacterium]